MRFARAMERTGAFLADRRGVAVVEFSLLLPLLILMLAVSVEAGRLFNAYRSLGQASTSIARMLAQFPEYDRRARDFAPPIANVVLPGGTTNGFNLQVTSLTRSGVGFTQRFTHTLFGADPGIRWQDTVQTANYDQNEPVIHVAATYDYRPMFGILPVGTVTLRKTLIVTPFFSRAYVWNDAVSTDKYVY